MHVRLALAAFLTVLAAALVGRRARLAGSHGRSPVPRHRHRHQRKGHRPAKRPARIVSLSPTATETLFAIGAGAQVVAVDDQSDYPKNAPRTTLSGFTPNVEAIAATGPTSS